MRGLDDGGEEAEQEGAAPAEELGGDHEGQEVEVLEEIVRMHRVAGHELMGGTEGEDGGGERGALPGAEGGGDGHGHPHSATGGRQGGCPIWDTGRAKGGRNGTEGGAKWGILMRHWDCIEIRVNLRRSAVFVCALLSLRGQDAGRRLTLEQALALAEENHPQLHSAQAQREGAEAAVVTARAYPNPESGYLAGHQRARIAGAVPGLNQVYSVTQPIETRQVRATRLRAAELGRASSGVAIEETRLQVRGAVKQAFYLVLRRQAEAAQLRGNLGLVEELRRRIEAQVKAGEAPKLELTRAEAEVAMAALAVRSAELNQSTARAALHAALGTALGPEVELAGGLPVAAAPRPLEQVLPGAVAAYPAVRLAAAEVRRAGALVEAEQALRRPQPSLRGEYEQQPDVATYRLGFSLPVPLWNQRQGPVAEAAAQLRRARAEEQARRLEVTSALEAAYGRYQLAEQQVLTLEQGVIRQAEAALRAAEAAHRFGERGILEVLDAQRLLRGARLDLLNAQYDRQAARLELEQLGAVETPAQEGQIR